MNKWRGALAVVCRDVSVGILGVLVVLASGRGGSGDLETKNSE